MVYVFLGQRQIMTYGSSMQHFFLFPQIFFITTISRHFFVQRADVNAYFPFVFWHIRDFFNLLVLSMPIIVKLVSEQYPQFPCWSSCSNLLHANVRDKLFQTALTTGHVAGITTRRHREHPGQDHLRAEICFISLVGRSPPSCVYGYGVCCL